jgi:hypothetical protein
MDADGAQAFDGGTIDIEQSAQAFLYHALAMERLTKYYEHVCRDHSTALLWSSRLLQVQADDRQHLRRKARLIERIKASS